ncbi:hypothetical protein IFM61606_06858 [Aspergillus udagawae]|nr:hypothetical protein IFM61606_06858 [Aspergillus udagawae]
MDSVWSLQLSRNGLYWANHSEHIGTFVDKLMEQEEDMIHACDQLLKMGAYQAIERIISRGVNLVREATEYESRDDFLSSLARWGFTDLFRTLGQMRKGDNWINGQLSKPSIFREDVLPFILVICWRTLPSLDLLHIVVDMFHADVNIQTYDEDYYRGKHHVLPSGSALHRVAGREALVAHECAAISA